MIWLTFGMNPLKTKMAVAASCRSQLKKTNWHGGSGGSFFSYYFLILMDRVYGWGFCHQLVGIFLIYFGQFSIFDFSCLSWRLHDASIVHKSAVNNHCDLFAVDGGVPITSNFTSVFFIYVYSPLAILNHGGHTWVDRFLLTSTPVILVKSKYHYMYSGVATSAVF